MGRVGVAGAGAVQGAAYRLALISGVDTVRTCALRLVDVDCC